MLTKYLLSLDGLMQKIVISKNMESAAVHLDRIHISDSCTCTNSNCSNIQHISDIDNLFDDICNALRVSSLTTITTCKKTLCQDYIVPGWNDYVKGELKHSCNIPYT